MKSLYITLLAGLLVVVVACGEPDPAASTMGSSPDETPSVTPQAENWALAEGECIITGVSVAEIPDVYTLAWVSDRIVIGEIARQHATVPDPVHPRLPLYTDYDVKVEKSIRGDDRTSVTIRQPGGSITAGCTDLMGSKHLTVGERFVLFLDRYEEPDSDPVFLVVGERQGYWRLNDDNILVDLAPHYSAYEERSNEMLIEEIQTSLLSEMPKEPLLSFLPVVPLSESPLSTVPSD